ILASIGAWTFELAMYWFIAEAFKLDASVPAIALAGAAANVSLSLPLAQGGVGAFEFAATKALREFDLEQNAAAAYSLALHFFLIVPVSLVGLAVLWRSTLTSSARATATAPAAVLDARD
ncbi:MAG TPA: lysylphosphatidylglycerol synthase domain-containing protein, partial [Dehalococcoidia bacterium]|nr:lysylphosphatidylglycerol synthase domain-containing protein [Dehalococcoidia bacterium]